MTLENFSLKRVRNVRDSFGNYMEGLTGIEPALSAWEAEVLPLNYSPVPVPKTG